MPGVLAVYTGAELAAAGIKPMPTTPDFRRADGQQDGVAAAPRARARSARATSARRSSPSSPNRARRRAMRSTASSSSTRSCPPSPTSSPRPRPARRRSSPDARRQHRRRDAPRRAPTKAAAAFARAAVRIELDLVNQRVVAGGDGAAQLVASFDAASGRLTVRISNQMPTAVAAGLAGALPGIAQEQVHVLVGDVGGGFGMKTGMYPEDIVVAHAARALGRPVHWQADRSEEFLSASARPRRHAATPSSRSTATARRWRCACARSPTSAPTRRRRASRSSC